MLPIDEIEPAYANALIYRPVNDDDPGIIELADSIRAHGVIEPLIVTKDLCIVSGHRRYAASGLAELTEVPCRVMPWDSDDPRFHKILVAANQQRVKTLDEILREAIAQANPNEVYRSLIEHREARASVNPALERIELRPYRGRKKISKAKEPMLKPVQEILEANRDFWPLSDRQVHYRLLPYVVLRHTAKPDSVYINTTPCYKDVTDLLTRARLTDEISLKVPFEAIGDETRPVAIWDTHQNPQSFLKQEIDGFLKGYWRDLLQSQPNHIEAIGEKLTVEGTIRPVLMKYTIPYTIGRGYASLDPRYKLVTRFRASGKEKLVLLTLHDFDPDGGEIGHSFARSLRDDFGLKESQIEPIRVALTADQIRRFQLPKVMEAKEKSSNYKRFVAAHPDKFVHELDALKPADLQTVLTEAIESVLDMAAFNAELEKEKQDAVWLNGVRHIVHQTLQSISL